MARRVPVLTRDRVPEKYRDAYDEVSESMGGTLGIGPTSVLINSPEMAQLATHLAEYLRKDSLLPQKTRELAMLIAARTMDCQFVWNAHAALGRRAGLSDALVDSLRDRKPLPASLPQDEAVAARYGLEICQDHRVSDGTFRDALDQLGVQALTEFTTYMGYYRILAMNANAFAIDLPESITEPLLPV